MYKCLDCGHIFAEPDAKCDRVPCGEGYVDGEYFDVCPACGGDWLTDDLIKCAECGEYILAEEAYGNICEECYEELVKEYENDPKKCLELCDCHGGTEIVNLPAVFAEVLEPCEINSILIDWMIKNKTNCRPFIECAPEWFVGKAREL